MQVRKRMHDTKEDIANERKELQERRRRQVIKYIKDYALSHTDSALREALTFLDNEAKVRPDAARG